MKNSLLFFFFMFHMTSGVPVQDHVQDLSDMTFKDAVKKNKNLMVTFYSPRCPHSRRLLPHWEKAAASLQNNNPPVPFAKVDCIGDGRRTCWSIPVRRWPTVIFYKDGRRQDTFTQLRITKNLVDYALFYAGLSLRTSGPPKCESEDHKHCVTFRTSKDYMCKNDKWVREKCKKMCRRCQAPGMPNKGRKGSKGPCAPCRCSGTRMYCKRLGLTQVPRNIPSNIKHLDLVSNKISNLRGDEFSGLSNLQSIALGRNNIAALPLNIFQSLPKLKQISLYRNKLTSIPKGVFDGLSALEGLLLSNNELSSIDDGVFDDLVNLKFLSLQNNKITSIARGVFDNMTFLTRLQLYRNQLTTLPPALFQNLNSLTYLQLHSNQLSNLQTRMFQGLVSLNELKLGRNNIVRLPPGIFSSFDPMVLRSLNLWGNPLRCTCGHFHTLGELRRKTFGKCDGNVVLSSLSSEQVCYAP